MENNLSANTTTAKVELYNLSNGTGNFAVERPANGVLQNQPKKKVTPIKWSPGKPREYTEDELGEIAMELLEYMTRPDTIYYHKFFLENYFLVTENVAKYCDRSKIFSDAVKIAKEIQQSKLIDKVMENEHNTAFTIFYFKNQYRWTDRYETIQVGETKPLQVNLNLGKTPIDSKTPPPQLEGDAEATPGT